MINKWIHWAIALGFLGISFVGYASELESAPQYVVVATGNGDLANASVKMARKTKVVITGARIVWI